MSSEQESQEAGLTYFLANRHMQNTNPRHLPWRCSVIVERECYTNFLDFMKTWRDDDFRCVVSGAPGIGKTTLIHYLIWLFLDGRLDYEWIVLGTAERLIAIAKDGKCNPHRTGDEPMLEKSLGLFDIKPDATVAEGQKSLNTQNANRHFRVCHMVIVATVGFRAVLGEFWKPAKSVKYFPTWSPKSSIGLSNLMGLSDSERRKRIDVCGDSVPRLVHEFGLEDLGEQVEKFCKAVFGAPNVVDKRAPVKQAHTMLVLQPSLDMKERECPSFVPLLTADADDGSAEAKPGEAIGLVSTYVRDGELTNANTSIERYTNATKSNISMDLSISETANAIRLINGANDDTDTNTYVECNNTTGGTTLFKPTYFKDSIYYETDNFNISNTSGFAIYKPTTDASNVVAIANNSGKLRFRGFSIDAYNTNDSSQQLFLSMNISNAVRCNKLGIGANAVVDVLNVNGGNSNFSSTVGFNGATTFNNEVLIWNHSKIYRRADVNNSLSLITNDEMNFSFQANRATDPTTATIALQLTDTNGITLNRAVTNNLTLNSIGRMAAESDLDMWGELFFQHSSSIKETLHGSDYDLDIRNGDTDRAINLIVGTIGSTPAIQLTEGKVSLFGNLEIAHDDITGQQRVLINNPDDNGWIRLSNNNLSR